MAVKYGKFQMPQMIVVDEESATSTFARFVAEPFEPGFGHTVGNSLRRMLLGALEAPAIVSIRFEDVPHEYTGIEGIVEDMTNIILNLKGALLRRLPKDDDHENFQQRVLTTEFEITQADLDANGGSVSIKFGDLMKEGLFEVVNPDLHLFTVTQPMQRQVDFRVCMGRGYTPSERQHIESKMTDEIVIDACFSPVRLVNYRIENTRVGQDTDFDCLILEVTTDGRITPREALSFAAQIGITHFQSFLNLEAYELVFEETRKERQDDHEEIMGKLALRIDEIELSVRSTNCLSGANIATIGELVTIPERRMLEFRNFGKKSLNEIKAKLSELGLGLGMDLSRYGITPDNVKDRLIEYYESRKAKADFAVNEEVGR